jgi:uncharacterized iron-regulated membrane protein
MLQPAAASSSFNSALASKTTKGSAKPFRRRALFVHRWTGLLLGIWIALLGLTGSALVYQHSLRLVLEQGRHIEPNLQPLSFDELLTRVRNQRSDVIVLGIRCMEFHESALEVMVRPTESIRDAEKSRVLLVDPGTGTIEATQTISGTPMGFLAQLHFNLLLGDRGIALNGFAAGLAILYTVTGLFLWWRGSSKWKNGFLIRLKGKSKRAQYFNVHSGLGLYASIFLIVTSVSGIYFAAPMTFVSFAARIDGSSLAIVKQYLSQPPSETRSGTPDASADRVLASAQASFPNSQLMQVTLPLRPTDAWRVQFRPHESIDSGTIEFAVVDRRSARVLIAHSTADLPGPVRAVFFLRPLHVGSFGGQITKIVWFVLGLTPAILFVTGFLMWQARLRQSKTVRP